MEPAACSPLSAQLYTHNGSDFGFISAPVFSIGFVASPCWVLDWEVFNTLSRAGF
ncbi:MAG: hypothetical protein JKY01_01060 [Pseudomonadales bacterium]|nr:hypothetical protein [Pseudomonadales bacterium]